MGNQLDDGRVGRRHAFPGDARVANHDRPARIFGRADVHAPVLAAGQRGDEREDRRAGAVHLPRPVRGVRRRGVWRRSSSTASAGRRRRGRAVGRRARARPRPARRDGPGSGSTAAATRRRRPPAPRPRPAPAASSPRAAPSRPCRCRPPATSRAPCSCGRSTAGPAALLCTLFWKRSGDSRPSRSRSSSISTSVVSSPNAEPTTTRSRDSGTPAWALACAATSATMFTSRLLAAPLLRLGVRRVRALGGAAGQPARDVGEPRHPQAHSQHPRAHRQFPLTEQQADVAAAERERVAEDVAAGRVHAGGRDVQAQIDVDRVGADAARDPSLFDGDDREHRLGRAARAQQVARVALGRRDRDAPAEQRRDRQPLGQIVEARARAVRVDVVHLAGRQVRLRERRGHRRARALAGRIGRGHVVRVGRFADAQQADGRVAVAFEQQVRGALADVDAAPLARERPADRPGSGSGGCESHAAWSATARRRRRPAPASTAFVARRRCAQPTAFALAEQAVDTTKQGPRMPATRRTRLHHRAERMLAVQLVVQRQRARALELVVRVLGAAQARRGRADDHRDAVRAVAGDRAPERGNDLVQPRDGEARRPAVPRAQRRRQRRRRLGHRAGGRLERQLQRAGAQARSAVAQAGDDVPGGGPEGVYRGVSGDRKSDRHGATNLQHDVTGMAPSRSRPGNPGVHSGG